MDVLLDILQESFAGFGRAVLQVRAARARVQLVPLPSEGTHARSTMTGSDNSFSSTISDADTNVRASLPHCSIDVGGVAAPFESSTNSTLRS
jgi:hypothetical protein